MLNRNTGAEALTRFAETIILARSVTSQTEKRISQRAHAVTLRAPKLSVFEASRGNGRKNGSSFVAGRTAAPQIGESNAENLAAFSLEE